MVSVNRSLIPNLIDMNRKERRDYMCRLGFTWRQAKYLAKQAKAEADFAAKASRMTAREAQQALAEWANENLSRS